MDDRVARLKSSREARVLASNAKRLGNKEIESAAIQRARELQAIEEGYTTPAERAIGEALIAYEDEMRKVKPKFRASRTRNMLERHTPLIAAERMVQTRLPSTGYAVLEEAGRSELSFESIIDRFPEEFSNDAVLAARARLAGQPRPRRMGNARVSPVNEAPVTSLSTDDYVEAIKHLQSESACRWMIAHYYASESTASMQELADTLGYESHATANAGYGAFAHKVADLLPHAPSDVTEGKYVDWMQAVGAVVGRNEFGHSQWRLRPEVVQTLQRMGWVDPIGSFPASVSDEPSEPDRRAAADFGMDDTQVRQMMLSRRGQGSFRRKVMQYWGNACAVSGLRHPTFLVASHIIPWREANPNERLDGYNGLALTLHLDKAFDKGLISFEPNGMIRISPRLNVETREALGIQRNLRLRFLDKRIEQYMAVHRTTFFQS